MTQTLTKKYISAGAGSGKTFRITTDVAKMVKDGTLNSDQVIMTTYTKAAAQELREKAKNELAKLGLLREAQQMEHALIGTVHSVANTLKNVSSCTNSQRPTISYTITTTLMNGRLASIMSSGKQISVRYWTLCSGTILMTIS